MTHTEATQAMQIYRRPVPVRIAPKGRKRTGRGHYMPGTLVAVNLNGRAALVRPNGHNHDEEIPLEYISLWKCKARPRQ